MPNRAVHWGGLLGTVVLSLLLYFLNALFFFFLVPLQVLLVRRGRGEFGIAAGLTLVGIALLALWRTAGVGSSGERTLLELAEIATSLVLVTGVFLVSGGWPSGRRLYRMLLSMGIAGVVSIPFLLLLGESKEFAGLLHAQVQAVVNVVKTSFGGGTDPATIARLLNVDRLTALVRQAILSNFLFAFFVVLAGSWRLGTLFTYRVQSSRSRALSEFFVPEALLWPTLAAWALVAVERATGLAVLGYIGWNFGMIGAFLYALQGVGIVQFLLARYRVPRGLKLMLLVSIVLMFFWPGTGMVVLVALPVLGISELWVRYGRGRVSEVGE